MENKEIAKVMKLGASLMELHGMNQFKVRSFSSAVRKLEGFDFRVSDKSYDELVEIDGIGKGLATNLVQVYNTGTFDELQQLLTDTPQGVVSMLNIKGLGVKKVQALWKDLGIENKGDLLKACNDGTVASAKGFGQKTAENIIAQLMYEEEQKGKFLYAEIEEYALFLYQAITPLVSKVELVGQFRLCREYIDCLQFVVEFDELSEAHAILSTFGFWIPLPNEASPFVWRGRAPEFDLNIEVIISTNFYNDVLKYSAAPQHLYAKVNDTSLAEIIRNNRLASEAEGYTKLGYEFVIPELRESDLPFTKNIDVNSLISMDELKGVLHNHSTYSDGKNTLREMAEYCKELGYEYLGISDHSKTAFYANGLDEDRIAEQHREIDALNIELAPFKIYKGIESDILNDGSLDYDDDVLASFDFIVASIHSNLNMDKAKATQRLLTAIKNPFTTMLGHPTGRLLLRREGYPIDHAQVIDACAEHNVIIEINANPWRLDLDWRWVSYAMEKGVKISINPDAHEMNGYHDMKYGVLVGRKGGLTTSMTFNSFSVDEVDAHFVLKNK